MRPHLLEINAFGPFAGTVSVDLDDLGAAGLLLLHGETGAGKTSVLDALGYALYGEVPGDRGIRGLRSEHAGGLDETWVRLTFSVGGRRLRIRRSPEQSVAKQRGEGSTTKRASVLLEEVGPDGLGVALATRLDEAGLIVSDAVGMTASQFFQVVLLPQGRFAEFLHAPAAARQALLQQLFNTERFADVEAALKARRDVLRADVDVLVRDRDAAVGLLGQVSLTAPDLVPAPGAHTAADWAHARQVSLAALAEAAEAEAEVAEAAVAAARGSAEAGARLAERQQRLTTLLAQQANLAEAGADFDVLRQRLSSARLAAPLASDVARYLDLLDQRPGLVMTRAAAMGHLAEAQADCPGVAGEGSALKRAAFDRLAVVTPVVAVERDLAAREQVRATAAAEAQAAEQRHVAAETELEAARERHARLASSLAVDEVKIHELANLSATVEALRLRASAATQLPVAEALAVEADGLLQTARAAALDARERWLDLRDRRLLGIAAELAAGLVDGEACAVCGGVDHPHPAAPRADAVTEVAEQQAHEAAELADRDLEPLRQAVQLATSTVAELRAKAGQPLAAGALARAESELSAVELLAGGLALRRAELEQATDALDQAAVRVVATDEALTVARTALAGLTGSLDEQRAQVEAAREGASSVAERERVLRALTEAVSAAVDAEAAVAELDRRLALLEAELAAGAEAAGFADVDAVVGLCPGSCRGDLAGTAADRLRRGGGCGPRGPRRP